MTNHHGVVHFELVADDPEKLSGFYKDLFGWQIDKMPMEGGEAYYGISTGPSGEQGPTEPGYIGGGLAKRMSPEQQPMNYVNVEDTDAYIKKAQGLGAQVLMGKMPVTGMGWIAQLRDPEGNLFGLWQTDMGAK
ncbi:MAG TPA: VOC family protein [Dehalococcoidia bacterium]|nr:VOC family protein [Dehalococcoidia bacterium]